MSKTFVFTKINNVKTGFYFDNSKLYEIQCYEADSRIGNIYLGRISNILKNLNAAFVDIENGESCYLPLEDWMGEKPPRENDLVLVQVLRDKIKSKQAAVTTKLSLSGESVVVGIGETVGISKKITDLEKRQELKFLLETTLDEFYASHPDIMTRFGGIIRTSAEKSSTDFVKEETVKLLCELHDILVHAKHRTVYSCMWQNVPAYLSEYRKFAANDDCTAVTDDLDFYELCKMQGIPEPNLYTDKAFSLSACYNLNGLLEKALSERAYLKSGGYLVIQPTEAMTVIDVNSGKSVKGSNAEESLFKINLEAAEEIARQLRIRNISGIIVVDFINMKSDSFKNALLQCLREHTADDSVETVVHDITRLGLVELTRRKVRKPLAEIIKNT